MKYKIDFDEKNNSMIYCPVCKNKHGLVHIEESTYSGVKIETTLWCENCASMWIITFIFHKGNIFTACNLLNTKKEM